MRRVFAPLRARLTAGSRRRSRRPCRPQLHELESRALLAAGPLGLNVSFDAYTTYVNWLQEPGRWLNLPGRSDPITLNASGNPASDAVLLFDYRVNEPWNGPDPNAVPPNLSGTYHLSFNGRAVIEPEYPGFSTPFTIENQTYNTSTNTTTAALVVPAGNTSEFFSIQFTDTRATPTSPTNTGFSNAKMIAPGYAANSTQLYTNQFLAALAPFKTLRYMDVSRTNDQPFYDGNTLVTVDASQVGQTGAPWEYLIALANQTNTDMWINIPQGATDDYVAALAGIYKNGGTVNGVIYPALKPNLKIYLEYSNEVWGGIERNYYYQEAAVQDTADNRPLSTFPSNAHIYDNPDGTTTDDLYTAVGRRYLERTYDIGRIFQDVLGADPAHERIRPVVAWQAAYLEFFPPAFDWFEQFFVPASTAFYGMGVANYWEPTDYSSVDAVIESLAAAEQSFAIPNAISTAAIASSYGLKTVSYEGGPLISYDGNTPEGQNGLAASRDPRMEEIVYQHYVNYFAAGGGVAAYFNGPFGQWGPYHQWGAAELSQYGNPSASPKYRGLVRLANAAPVATSAGIQASAGATFVKADTTTRGDWKSAYGADGFAVSQDPSSNNPTLPAYASLTVIDDSQYIWTPSTSDPRGLQMTDPGSDDRIASTWFSHGDFTFDLDLGDDQGRQLALYAVDYDHWQGGRVQRIDLLDASTDDVLDSRTLTDFVDGIYLVWDVTGHVKIRVTNLNPDSNAVISGLFLG